MTTEIGEEPEKLGAFHHENGEKYLDTAEAKQAWEAERTVPLLEALRNNWRAAGWSVAITMAIVMEGYDTALISSFFGYPSFQKKYGTYYADLKEYQVSSPWQAGLNNIQTVGLIIGAFLNGWSSNRFGYKRTMLVSLAFMNATLFINFFAPKIEVLLVGQLLNGLPWGVFATTGPAYASEVCPLALRGYLTVYSNLCWAIGQLIASGVLKALVNNPTQWSYRIPFAVQWIWPLPLFLIILFAPESPWWLVKKNRLEDAERSLHRLADKTNEEATATLAQMVYTIKIEEELEHGTSYWQCFRGVDLRRTEICCMTWMGQMLSGAMFAYGPSYFFEQAGMSANEAYIVGIGSTALAFLGTICSWFLLTYFGRRTLYLNGMIGMTIVLLLIGILSVSTSNAAGMWAQASFCLIWQLIYSLTVGPICYAIVAETSAMRLRAKTVVLSRSMYNVVTIVAGVLEPYMMNPSQWNWKGKTGFFWAGTAALTAVWVFFRLPEAKGRSYEELDLLFAKKIPARKFKSTQIDVYGPTETESRR